MLMAVHDPDDPRLGDYVRLRDSQLRRSIETERGLFIAEGEKIIRRASEAGCMPRSFLLQERWLEGLADVLEQWPGIDCYVVSGQLAEEVSGFHVHRGALASFVRPEEACWETLLGGRRLLLCESLVDHANMGGIMRTAAAFGWDGVVVSHDSADPLYRRAVKASMGASLSVPWRRMAGDADLARIEEAGFEIVATTLADDSIGVEDFTPGAKLAVMMGSEGHGLSRHWSSAAHRRVRIPITDAVDSLNVASACAIVSHAWR